MTSEQNFQVNLGGVITLLSDHLYSGPDVFVRELLQNSVDAITARRKLDPKFVGKIRIEVLQDERGNTISIEEDGVGLTESEIHLFLATIGQSSKSGDFSRDDFIGQFGIGLLSAFVVSDVITVITQSVKDDSPTLQWTGRANGTYNVRKLDSKLSTGTRVYLQAKKDMEEFFQPQRVRELVKHFGRHLPYSVSLQVDGRTEEMTEVAPWAQTFTNQSERRKAWLAYGRETFGVGLPRRRQLAQRFGCIGWHRVHLATVDQPGCSTTTPSLLEEHVAIGIDRASVARLGILRPLRYQLRSPATQCGPRCILPR